MSDAYIRVVNWERFQHYKHRNPPWIKLYCEMLSSRTWVTLDDSSRVLALAVLMLAGRHENKIPMDAGYLKRVAYLNAEPNFTGLLETNFVEIVDASNMLATCMQDASNLHHDASRLRTNALPETEKSREEKKEPLCPNSEKPSSNEALVVSLFSPEETPTPEPTPPDVGRSSKAKPTPEATPSHEAEKLSQHLKASILEVAPNVKITQAQERAWAKVADRLLRLDDRTYEEAAALITWATHDEFWFRNVLCMTTFRKQYTRLEVERDKAKPKLTKTATEYEKFKADFLGSELPQ